MENIITFIFQCLSLKKMPPLLREKIPYLNQFFNSMKVLFLLQGAAKQYICRSFNPLLKMDKEKT